MTVETDQLTEELEEFANGGDVAGVVQDESEDEFVIEEVQTPAEDGTHESSGGWVLKISPKHRCIQPRLDAQTFVGSLWQCGTCQQYWLVSEKAGEKVLRRTSASAAQKKLARKA